ncbi:MAG: hypothetical protein J6Y94_07280 [Bacteriovoracaceae bacterium]|nr:hypothetical protein [Bacteriovoracaceae bacterium]
MAYSILILSFASILEAAEVPRETSFRSFETTRLKSTAGSGIASILMDEASILNPAAVAFFQVSSIYMQKSGGEFKTESSGPQSQVGQASLGDKLNSLAFIASDGNQRLSGSLSFIQQKEGLAKRRQIGLASASSIGSKTALGFTTTIQKDELPHQAPAKRWRFNLGILHALSENLSLGLVALDPWKKNLYLTQANLFLGIQYVYDNTISLIFDIGSNFYQSLNENLVTRGAIQLKVLKDLFLRVGAFEDRGRQEKGNGIGIGWAGPKLVFELAIKNTKVKSSTEGSVSDPALALPRTDTAPTLHESSFSMAYHF